MGKLLEKISKVIEYISEYIPKIEYDTVDPKIFNDDFAIQIEWTTMGYCGSIYKIVKVLPSRLEFRHTLSSKTLHLIFIFIGLISIITMFMPGVTVTQQGNTYLVVIIAMMFSAVGIYGYKNSYGTKFFDTHEGYYWNENNEDEAILLVDIHAIQLLKRKVYYNKNSSTSDGFTINIQKKRYKHCYEINLILKNKERINIADYTSTQAKAIIHAEILANFLNVPLWNASKYTITIQTL